MGASDQLLAALEEPLLNAEQAAALLNVKPSWVREATRQKRLPCVRFGKHVRYTREGLAAYVAEHRERGRAT
jgi:excisionase family DNA binding protein